MGLAPKPVPKMVTDSPGDTPPPTKLAAFTTPAAGKATLPEIADSQAPRFTVPGCCGRERPSRSSGGATAGFPVRAAGLLSSRCKSEPAGSVPRALNRGSAVRSCGPAVVLTGPFQYRL